MSRSTFMPRGMVLGACALLVLVVFAFGRWTSTKTAASKDSRRAVSRTEEATPPRSSESIRSWGELEPGTQRALLTGRVEDGRGRAVGGASVCAVSDAPGASAHACTQSDTKGAFVLEPANQSPQTLLVSRAGFEPATHGPVDATTRVVIVIKLQPGGAHVAGTVLDASGGPIAGAALRVMDDKERPVALGFSDGSGRFRLDLADGTVRLRTQAEGYAGDERVVDAPASDLELRLAPESSIAGHVVMKGSQAPVAGVLVTARNADALPGPGGAARTLDDGSFRLLGLRPGRYVLDAVSDTARGAETTLTLEPARSLDSVVLEVSPATRVSGVLRLGGKPCAQGFALLEGPLLASASSDRDGRLSFEGVTPGSYRVSLGCEAARATDELVVRAEREERVWNLDAGQAIQGDVLTPSGRPVPQIEVHVMPSGDIGERGGGSCVTDDRGSFECRGLAVGDYEVQVGSGEPPRAELVKVSVTAGASPRVVLHTRAAGEIRARVANRDGFEPGALAVLARGERDVTLSGQARGDEFVFEAAPLGTYEVFADTEPRGAALNVTLTDDGQVVQLTLASPAAHTLSGRVVDEDGQGIPGLWVHLAREGRAESALQAEPLLTDYDGTFSRRGLLPGRYALEARAPSGVGRLEGVASDSKNLVVRVEAPATTELDE